MAASSLVAKRQTIAKNAVASAAALLDAAGGLKYERQVELQLDTGFQDSDFTIPELEHTDKATVDAVLGDISTALEAFLDAPIQGGGSPRRDYLLKIKRA